MPGSLYQSIYLFLIFVLTAFFIQHYTQRTLANENRRTAYRTFSIFLAIALVLFIGFRPVSIVFVDMISYDFTYSQLMGKPFYFDLEVDNLIYDNWFTYMASLNVPVRAFFVIVAFIYFGMMWLACNKLFPRDTIIAFLVYLAAFSTFAYATNGLKAGMAASIFLVALAYNEKPLISIPLAIFTYGMHHSMALVITAYLVTYFIRNPKYYFVVWALTFCIAALHITYFQHLFANFTDEHGASYLLSSENSGFRLDFIIYSAVPVIVGYILIFKYKLTSKTYNLLLSLYMLTNSLWMLCMYSNFTNRISYLSWLLYPIVLLYPFLNLYWSNKQVVYLRYVVWGHLGFTLFMNIIYYGLIK